MPRSPRLPWAPAVQPALDRAHPGAPSTPPASIQTRAGAEAFRSVCEPCHGPKAGRGRAVLGSDGEGLVEVLVIVREGSGQMPPVSPRELTDEDITRIVEYLTSLR